MNILFNTNELFNSIEKYNVDFLRKWLGYLLRINLSLGFINVSFSHFQGFIKNKEMWIAGAILGHSKERLKS